MAASVAVVPDVELDQEEEEDDEEGVSEERSEGEGEFTEIHPNNYAAGDSDEVPPPLFLSCVMDVS
jgi:hypothetical protein